MSDVSQCVILKRIKTKESYLMNCNSILGRYLSKQILVTFFMVLLTIMGIIMMFDSIEALRRISGRDDTGMDYVVKYAITKLPETIDKVLPFVMMVAAMITFWKASKNNEYVIIRASGISTLGFLKPIFVTVFIVGVINVLLFNPISSKMYEMHATLKHRFVTHDPTAMLFSSRGLWIREALGDKILVIQAKSVRQEKDEALSLSYVSILEMDKNAQIGRRIEGLVGSLKDKHFKLRGVQIFKSGQKTENLPSYEYDTTITLQRIKENFVDPNAISFWNLPDTIRFYESSGFSAARHRMRYLSLIASPFLLIAMVLVSSLFSLMPSVRQGGVMLMIVIGVAVGFIVYFSSQLIYAFGLNGYIPIWLAVWSPAVIVTLLGTTCMLFKEDA